MSASERRIDDRTLPGRIEDSTTINLETVLGRLQMVENSLNSIKCDPTHQYWALCDLFGISTVPSFLVQTRFSQTGYSHYFSDDSLMATFARADSCPKATERRGINSTLEVDATDGYSGQTYMYSGEQMCAASRCIKTFLIYLLSAIDG